MTPPIEIEVRRAIPIKWGYCRACNARIEWVTTNNKRHMPIDWPLIVLREFEGLDGDPITVIDAAQSHFATCPAADQFRRRARP